MDGLVDADNVPEEGGEEEEERGGTVVKKTVPIIAVEEVEAGRFRFKDGGTYWAVSKTSEVHANVCLIDYSSQPLACNPAHQPSCPPTVTSCIAGSGSRPSLSLRPSGPRSPSCRLHAVIPGSGYSLAAKSRNVVTKIRRV